MIKCVITAGGKGTRLLPMTKEIPKEMMPIFSRDENNNIIIVPLLQYIFEQLYSNNLKSFCFVVGNKKKIIQNHFNPQYTELREFPNNSRKVLEQFNKKLNKSYITWAYQNKPLGFGDAVKKAEKFVDKDNFIVHAGDAIIHTKTKHPIHRMIDIAKNDPSVSVVLLCKKVIDSKRYGVPKIKKISKLEFLVEKVEEKPKKPKSNLGILPIYYFKPSIFDALKKIKRDKNNEFQLTDAIQHLIENGEKVVTTVLTKNEKELDMGTVETFQNSQRLSYLN